MTIDVVTYKLDLQLKLRAPVVLRAATFRPVRGDYPFLLSVSTIASQNDAAFKTWGPEQAV